MTKEEYDLIKGKTYILAAKHTKDAKKERKGLLAYNIQIENNPYYVIASGVGCWTCPARDLIEKTERE